MKTQLPLIEATKDPFQQFWNAYPRKEAKVVAQRAFSKAIQKTTLQSMIAAVQQQLQGDQWQRGFIPHAATWLNQERWTDEPSAVTLAKPCLTNTQAQISQSEYLRVIDRMKVIKSQYEAHQQWDEKDRNEYKLLKNRSMELRAILGILI